MPQFFFDFDAVDERSSVGPVELGTKEEARQYAIGLLTTVFHGVDSADHAAIRILDKDGNTINLISFGDK